MIRFSQQSFSMSWGVERNSPLWPLRQDHQLAEMPAKWPKLSADCAYMETGER